MNKELLFKEFKTALIEEIEHIKKSGGNVKIFLFDGKLISVQGNRFIYEFVTETPIELNDDTPIAIRYNDETLKGNIITIDGVKVQLELEKNLGEKVPQVILTTSTYFLLEILYEKILKINSKQPPPNIEMAMKVFGFQKSSIGEDNQFLTDFNKIEFSISEEQKRALAKSLGNEVTFVWGPPGTGKTTLLSYLVCELLLRDKNILLVSHTNVAIDNAIERIAKLLRNDEKYLEGKILRVGSPSLENKDLFSNFPELSVEKWVECKSMALQKKREQFREILRKEKHILNLIQFLKHLDEKRKKALLKLQRVKNLIREKKIEIKKSEEKIENLKEKLNKAKQAHPFLRFLLRLNPQKLKSSLEDSFKIRDQLRIELFRLYKAYKIRKKEVCEFEKEYENQKSKLKFLFDLERENLSEKQLTQEEEKRKNMIKEIEKELRKIEEKIQKLEDEIIRESKLIATTLTKAYLKESIYNRLYDVVIIDEASMAPLPALFLICGLATSKVIVVGDFQQLPPIAMSNNELVKKWLKTNIFQVAGITEKIERKEKENRIVILKEQRRMPKEIAEVVNRLIYQGYLISAEKTHKEKKKEELIINSEPFRGEKIVICDTSEFNPWCTQSASYKSPFNIYSAFLSVFLAEKALSDGVENIAIITPYRAQNNLLYKLISEKMIFNENFKKVRPASIHKFQGKQAELVILDLVEGPIRKIKWLNGGFNSEAMRLINVAITRTKAKLIIVANLQYLKRKLAAKSVLRKILEEVEKKHLKISAQQFFSFLKNHFKETEILKVDDKKPYLCDQSLFYKAFKKDLLEAEEEVIIVSPFITTNRIVTFEKIFRILQEKQVKVFLITKPFKEQKISSENGEELLTALKKVGVEVVFKPYSHEKLAIIDKKIIWHGSLNILSHRNTSELMIRFTTKKKRFSNEILKLCGINVQKVMEEKVINERIEQLNKKGIGFCSKGHPLVIKRGSCGIFISCSKFPQCKEKKKVTYEIIKEIFGEKYLICEKCGSLMKLKFNPKRKRWFLGCSKYPTCRFTRLL